jgi:hypothetical protein
MRQRRPSYPLALVGGTFATAAGVSLLDATLVAGVLAALGLLIVCTLVTGGRAAGHAGAGEG